MEAGAETFEHVRYSTPAGWTAQATQDGKSYLYRDATASGIIVLFNSRPAQLSPAAAFEEDWRMRMVPVCGVAAPVPQLAQEGDVTAATGVVTMLQQGNPVMAVLVTLVGRGRALSVVAIASGDGGRHVTAFLDTLAVAPPPQQAPPAKPPPARGKPRPARGGELAGLYLWQGMELKFRPDFSGLTCGKFELALSTSFYLLSPDGRLARGSDLPAAPDGDIRRFDFDDYQRRDPRNSGTFEVEGGSVILQMGAGTNQPETVIAPIRDDGQLDIYERKYALSIEPR